MHSMYVPLAISLIGSGVPVVGSEHIVPQHYDTRRMEYLLAVLSALLIRRFTVLSERIRASYPWLFRRKAVAIPNPVHITNTTHTEKRKEHGGKTVLCVGRLEAQKDHATLIKAFGRIADQFPDWNLRVIGEGFLRPQLESEVATLGLGDRVALPGTIAEIGNEYAAANIFVLPSLYESFGLVTAEAMGHGLPVIGFEDCPGTNELIQDGVNGILVNSSDRVANLSRAMTALMQSRPLREELGARGKAAIERFSPSKIFTRWSDLLEEIS